MASIRACAAAMILACACAGAPRSPVASIERGVRPSRFGASAESTIVRVAIDGERSARWLTFDPSHPERVRSFAIDGARPRETAAYARALPEEGTFEAASGFAFEGSLGPSERGALVLVRWSQAQGAVDPRTLSQSLLVLRVSADRVEPSLECQLFFSVTQGPDRATVEESERSYRVVDRSIIVREGSRESRATLEAGRWRVEGERWCAVAR